MTKEWIEWSSDLKHTATGEGRPVDGKVDYKLRYGATYFRRPAEELYWDTLNSESDIVEYRVSNAAS